MKYTLEVYETKTKKRPFKSWLDRLDGIIKYMIVAKLERICLGNFGNCKILDHGIGEIKIDTGPGYRIYYSVVGLKIVLLLCAGDKKTQQKDIAKLKNI